VAAFADFLFVLTNGGWVYGQALTAGDPRYLQGTTACLTAIILLQVANVFACRSERVSLFTFGPFRAVHGCIAYAQRSRNQPKTSC
jgi:hypothetical protein